MLVLCVVWAGIGLWKDIRGYLREVGGKGSREGRVTWDESGMGG